MAMGPEFATVVTDTGIELSAVSLDRIHWRPKRKRFDCFSSQVHEAVVAVAKSEVIPFGRRNSHAEPGSFMVCHLADEVVAGFVLKRVTGGYLVSLPRARRWVAKDAWIAFDAASKVWVAKGSEGTRIRH